MSSIFTSYVLGLLTPLTAVCVLPLYPGFISYLTHQLSQGNKSKYFPVILGLVVTLGVISFMGLMGIIFTLLFGVSLTSVINIVSPIAFGILTLVSVALILDYDIGKLFPKFNAPTSNRPLLSAFLFGFFFGAIVVPCNPGLIIVFFTTALLSASAAVSNLFSFLLFGLGLATPLLVFSVLSTAVSSKIISFFTKHKSIINRITGAIMLVISLYYIIFVFHVFGSF